MVDTLERSSVFQTVPPSQGVQIWNKNLTSCMMLQLDTCGPFCICRQGHRTQLPPITTDTNKTTAVVLKLVGPLLKRSDCVDG
jgi:hypothetical protein